MRIVFSVLLLLSLLMLLDLPSAQAQPSHGLNRVVQLHGGGVIHGRRQQPAVITVLPRARVRHDRSERRARFLPEVARAVQRRPF